VTPATPDGVSALQQTLAAEHAAVFVFGALGGRSSSLAAPALRSAIDRAYAVHLRRRDLLRAMVTQAGAEPVAAEPAYRLPAVLTSRSQIEAESLRVERSCAVAYAALVAATSGRARRWAVEALVATAVGEREFGGRPQALPGLRTT
jgi:hypothetical protein